MDECSLDIAVVRKDARSGLGDVGVPFFTAPGQVDKGRYGGIQVLKASPLNRLGAYSDDRSADGAVRTRHVQVQHRNWGEFKVPSLRNVAVTAP